jgi:hypothetical protein
MLFVCFWQCWSFKQAVKKRYRTSLITHLPHSKYIQRSIQHRDNLFIVVTIALASSPVIKGHSISLSPFTLSPSGNPCCPAGTYKLKWLNKSTVVHDMHCLVKPWIPLYTQIQRLKAVASCTCIHEIIATAFFVRNLIAIPEKIVQHLFCFILYKHQHQQIFFIFQQWYTHIPLDHASCSLGRFFLDELEEELQEPLLYKSAKPSVGYLSVRIQFLPSF